MENKNRNVIGAAILIGLGLLFLGKEFDLFDFHWGDLARFWPILLIIIGLNLVLGKRDGQLNSILIILCFLAIPFGIVRNCENNWDHKRNWHWDSDDNDDEDNASSHDDGDHSSFGVTKSQNFAEDMETGLTAANLEIKSGVAKLDVKGTTAKLFEADTKSTFVDYTLKKSVDNGTAKLIFSMNEHKGPKGGSIHIDGDNIGKNEATLKLNETLPWNLKLDIGVSGADLDLSPFNIESLDLNTGVSGVDIKLGDKQANANIEINAGVAGIKVEVPSSVGVKVKSDGFLTGNDLDGFEKRDGYYYSPNYNSSTKKINIDYKGAIGGFEVKRY